MNKNDFLQKLAEHAVFFSRHGSRHDIYIHTPTGKKIAVPRHSEYSNDFLKLILKEIPKN